ncbi:MAG: phage tail tape measure protein [Clostridia bacterium]|nr:phage tail tape measure protein [Clostridia bacterium]
MAEILLKVRLDDSTYKSQLAELEAQVGKIVSSTTKTPSMNVDSLQKSFANLLNTLKGAEGKYAVGTFQSLKTEISECLGRVKELNAEIGDNKPTKAQKAELAGLTKQLSELQAKFATVRAETAKLSTVQGTSSNAVKTLQKSYANLINSLNTVKNKYPAGTFDNLIAQAKEGLTATKNLNTEVGTSATLNEKQGATLQMLSGKYQQLAADVATVRAETEQNTSAVIKNGDSIGAMAKKFIIWQAAATLVMKPLQLIRDAISSINETLVETENAVVALRRVAGTSANADELYDLAQRYGQTFENVNEIALNFARSGMDWTDTIKATEAALLALNVAELDATQASDGMIAIMQQFGYEASELELIIDKLNISADNAAVSTEKLLAALQRTGSSAKNANLTLEETVGIITAISEATGRSGENIGTAVNSLIQFTTKESSLATFEKLGGDVAKVVEDYRMGAATVLDIWEELSKVIQSKNSSTEGILSGLFADDDWRSLNEELQTELGENFATVTEIYGTASTFRKNYFIALLNNLDQVQETMDDMNSAEGYSQKENEQYLDTYSAKVNELKAQWQDMANDEQGILGIKKSLVEFASNLLTVLDKLGGIKFVLTEILVIGGTLLMTYKGTAIIAGLQKIWGLLRTLSIDAIPNAIAAWRAYAAGIVSANTAIQASIPIIGMAIAAISLLATKISDAREKERQAAEEARQELINLRQEAANSIASYENISNSLNETIERVKELRSGEDLTADATKELISIQESLIKNNGDLAGSIDLVNGKLEEQIPLMEQVAKAQLQQWIKDNQSAINTSEELVTKSSRSVYEVNDRGAVRDIYDIAKNAGIDVSNVYGYKKIREKDFWDYLGIVGGIRNLFDPQTESFDGIGTEGTVEEKLEEYNKLYEYIRDNAEELGLSEDKKKKYLSIISQAIKSLNTDDYKNAKETYDYYQKIQKYLNGEISYQEFLTGVKEETNETEDDIDGLKKAIEELDETNLNNLIAQFEKLRDVEKESVELEEKKKELLEAEQALLDAKQQRSVRVFNVATGQWEQIANEKSVKKAEENLEQARIEYEQQAYSSIISLLESEDKSTSAMVKLLAVIAETMPEISNKAQSILSEAGVDIPTYDSGGFLHGLGGIKATGRAETILPPGITEKIIEPSSNERFKNFTRSLGLLFGTSDKLEQLPRGAFVSNRGGDTTNNNNSRSYSINGVPIPAEIAQTHTLAELCDTMTLLE